MGLGLPLVVKTFAGRQLETMESDVEETEEDLQMPSGNVKDPPMYGEKSPPVGWAVLRVRLPEKAVLSFASAGTPGDFSIWTTAWKKGQPLG
jgi:hypothetical protein